MMARKLFSAFTLVILFVMLTGMGGKPKEEAPAPAPAQAEKQPADQPVSQAASAEPQDPAAITSVTLRDPDILRLKKPIIVTFSDPMSASLDTPVAADAMPFTLSPAVPGEGRWLTDRSFAFIAQKPYAPGRTYSLLFKDSLKTLDGRPVRYFFSFKTRAPKLERLQPEAFDPASARQVLHLDFSMPVTRAALKDHLTLGDAATGEPLSLSFAGEEDESSTQTIVAELGQYRPQIALSIRADKDGEQNPLGMQEPYSIRLTIPDPASDDAAVRVESDGESASPLRMYEPYTDESSSGKLYARFGFSSALATHSQKDFIEVTPDLPYTFDADGHALVLRENLEPGMQVSVTLKPGLADAAGRVLKERLTQHITIRDYEPAVRFAEPGNFLTPEFGSRVALNMINVDQVTVSLQRQYDNNLPFMALDPDYNAVNMMRDLAFKEVKLGDVKNNETVRKAVDIEEMAKGQRGVFMLTARGYKAERDSSGNVDYQYANTQRRLVVLTDIGLTARAFPSGVTVFASGLSTGTPLADAEIRVYSSSNQIIARGHTGADGVFTYQRPEEWDPQLQPHIVVARHGEAGHEDMTFLPLEPDTSIELPDPADRPYLDSGFEAFVYTPRGVFRPGENVDIKALVRDARHNPPAPFPVLFRVMSSRGLEMAKGSALLSAEGAGDFSFALPKSAPAGQYSALVEIPGQKHKMIGETSFSVEDFVPPRLEVEVAPGEERLGSENPLPVNLNGRYLFGAPGANLNFELGYRVSPRSFTPEGWEGYTFGDGERKFSTQSNLKYITGKLSDAGEAAIRFKAPADWRPPALLNVLLIGSVQEDGGRWVTQTNTVTYFPTPWLLGLKVNEERLEPGKQAEVSIAAVTPEGASAELGPVSVEFSLVQGNWHTIYKDGRYVYTWNERFVPQEKTIVEGKDGKAGFRFTPKGSGRYLIRAAAADGSIVASRRVSVYADGETLSEEGTGRMDTVEMRFDKKDYRPGDTARLSIKAPYTGTLLLGLERGRQISTRVMALDQPSAELEIPVTEDMDPNITVTAWVVRAVRAEEREWFSHRACGMAGLLISKEPNTLRVSPSVPERSSPSAPLSIPFTVTDEQGTPVEGEFSVALVDEGILSLTAFRTPDPVAFFLERRRAVGNSYDAFDALLRPEAKATPLLTPGGDATQDYQGSLSTQQIFLTAYIPSVRTDANGQGVAELSIPEYSGKGRLMIVGASQNRFASAEAPVRIARDIVVEASAPRAVAPGDSFAVPLNLFTLQDNGEADGQKRALPKEAFVRVTARGPLTLTGDTDMVVRLDGSAPPAPAARAAADNPAGEKTAPAAHKNPALVTGPGPALTGNQPGDQPNNQPDNQPDNQPGSQADAQATAQPENPAEPAGDAAEPQPGEQAPASAPTQAEEAATQAMPGRPLSQALSVGATASRASGIATITVEVLVPEREDLSFSKTMEIAVRPPYPRTAEAVSSLVRTGSSKTLAVPGTWLPGNVKTAFVVDKSPVLAILPALEYLREYPYGCLEQTVSRAWPYLTLGAVQAALYPDTDKGGNAKAVLADAVARIGAMQGPSGGFSLWPGYVEADPWRSAATTFFLLEAKAVTPVPQSGLDAALGYMRAILATPPESLGSKQYAYTTKAFAAFVLTRAGQPPLSWLQHLTEQEGSMLPSGRIFLAGAKALKAGNTKALKDIEGAMPALSAFKLGYNGSLESDIRNQALLLFFWAELDPGAEHTSKLAAGLAQSLAKTRYYTTQEAGMASMALGVYLEKSGLAQKGAYKATITPEGGPSVTVENGERFIASSTEAPLDKNGAVPQVSVAVAGEGEAYCLYSVRGTPLERPEPVSHGLAITRVWKTPEGKVIDLSSGEVRVAKGDRIIVELTVKTDKALADVAVSDLLPGGLEVENPRLKTAAEADEQSADNTRGGMFIDQREDRMLVFFDHVDRPRTYTYSLRAVSKGTFVLPPAAADGMYDPAFKAVGATGTVIVE